MGVVPGDCWLCWHLRILWMDSIIALLLLVHFPLAVAAERGIIASVRSSAEAGRRVWACGGVGGGGSRATAHSQAGCQVRGRRMRSRRQGGREGGGWGGGGGGGRNRNGRVAGCDRNERVATKQPTPEAHLTSPSRHRPCAQRDRADDPPPPGLPILLYPRSLSPQIRSTWARAARSRPLRPGTRCGDADAHSRATPCQAETRGGRLVNPRERRK